jgi:hypothetical protein
MNKEVEDLNLGKILFLDDWRMPIDCAKYMFYRNVDCKIYHQEWDIVRSYGDFVKWITENGLPNLISFDHDLADVEELKEELSIYDWFDIDKNREYTGVDCARWLTNYCLDNSLKLPSFVIHSANPEGSKNIESVLNSFNKYVEN